jgi:hypothetical protein
MRLDRSGICHAIAVWVDYCLWEPTPTSRHQTGIELKIFREQRNEQGETVFDFPKYYTNAVKFFEPAVPIVRDGEESSHVIDCHTSLTYGDSDFTFRFDFISI